MLVRAKTLPAAAGICEMRSISCTVRRKFPVAGRLSLGAHEDSVKGLRASKQLVGESDKKVLVIVEVHQGAEPPPHARAST